MQAFVPKNRRPKFELRLKILDLNNVPLVSGSSYVKWHLPSSTAAEHGGRTAKCVIKDHKVQWDHEKIIPVRLTVDKTGMLQESEIHLEVVQEYASGARGERIILGHVVLNLAEYVEGGDAEEGITRRYLMQDSKINSTLRISIAMKQLEGEKNFFAPPLKTAPVFGGIAGIMSNEQPEQDELGHLNTMNFKSTEARELQDMYRRTLAASFAAQAGELPADECIESIFAGGDGWRDQHETNPIASSNSHRRDQSRSSSSHRRNRSLDGPPGSPSLGSGSSYHLRGHQRQDSRESLSGLFPRRKTNSSTSLSSVVSPSMSHHDDGGGGSGGGGGGGASRSPTPSSPGIELGSHTYQLQQQGRKGGPREVDELEMRDDLRSWTIAY